MTGILLCVWPFTVEHTAPYNYFVVSIEMNYSAQRVVAECGGKMVLDNAAWIQPQLDERS